MKEWFKKFCHENVKANKLKVVIKMKSIANIATKKNLFV
jgi:hypothetical protein